MFVDRPVGIDLGTTNSEIAMLDPSERDLHIYADRFGRRTVPSAVAWDPKGEAFLVGHAARQRRGKTPPPIESIKRKMGQNAKVDVGPHALAPEDVSAKILAELRARMSEHLGKQAAEGIEVRVDRAVITVPAYFDAPQVEATRKAGEMAGLDVIGILQEPTAAAIYHTWKSRLGDGNFLVYDLGGGTFDVSILRCLGGEYQVLAIDGDNYLGGDDFDRRFAEKLRGILVARGYALDLDVRGDEGDRQLFGRLVHLAQEIKESLSTSEVVSISKQDFMQDKSGENVSFEGDIGRADYEKAVGDLVETTITCCERALARSAETSSVDLGQIDHVVLVGGSTRVPMVVRRVTEAICKKSRSDKPLQDEVDTCVALGAAIHAAQLGGLRIGEPDRKITVSFTTPLVSQGAKIRLGVRVEQAPEGAAEIAVLRGMSGADEIAKAAIPDEAGAVVRLDVPLGEEPEHASRVALRSVEREVLAELPFALYRGDVRPRASALSRPSVVAKDLAIEVVRAGRRERRVLIARGAGLPAEVKSRFFTADQSGAVVLRLLQNRMPIKTLLLQVPRELPVGTPVDLTLRCDDAMRMEARAVVAGQELWAQVEPPAAPRFDPAGAVEALLEEAEATSKSLWGSSAMSYRAEADMLVAGIREVVATDPDKLQALCEKLRLLVDWYRGDPNETLSPPMARFEAELNELRRRVYRASGNLYGMDRAAWEKRLAEIEARAMAAYEASDAVAWRRVFNEVQALDETAMQEEFAQMRLDDPAYLERRLRNERYYAQSVERQLVDFVPSSSDVGSLQIAERDKLVVQLQEKVLAPLANLTADTTDAAALRRKLEAINAETSRIDGARERLPSLGLVTERGGA
ncbi:Hsp70 family protein [Polyangium mundeleinium]|uniref:Hsp70 family protein n=1 Tax=Polyangium mundeleinium TaxID=2995306 RepID=A0ABT5ELV6_9BACT|nr:Hsp70 family protein [Polyangium mundeleinium]MDC0742804.1 Hsp70 family protein [Polyangium mundeleinium]